MTKKERAVGTVRFCLFEDEVEYGCVLLRVFNNLPPYKFSIKRMVQCQMLGCAR